MKIAIYIKLIFIFYFLLRVTSQLTTLAWGEKGGEKGTLWPCLPVCCCFVSLGPWPRRVEPAVCSLLGGQQAEYVIAGLRG